MPANEVWEFVVSVPAGTPIATPLLTLTQIPARTIDSIAWDIPPGALGVVGFFIGMRGVQVVPQPPGTWLIRSGQTGAWPLTGQPDSGDWSVTAYNTGLYAHAIHVSYHAKLLERVPERIVVASNWALSDTAVRDDPDGGYFAPVVRGPFSGY